MWIAVCKPYRHQRALPGRYRVRPSRKREGEGKESATPAAGECCPQPQSPLTHRPRQDAPPTLLTVLPVDECPADSTGWKGVKASRRPPRRGVALRPWKPVLGERNGDQPGGLGLIGHGEAVGRSERGERRVGEFGEGDVSPEGWPYPQRSWGNYRKNYRYILSVCAPNCPQIIFFFHSGKGCRFWVYQKNMCVRARSLL